MISLKPDAARKALELMQNEAAAIAAYAAGKYDEALGYGALADKADSELEDLLWAECEASAERRMADTNAILASLRASPTVDTP